MILKLKEKIKNILSETYVNYILIIIAALAICMPLTNSKLNTYRDDGVQHICRLIGTYQTLTAGECLPMIMSNLCNNFGYSWNIFYSPITAYVPLLFKIFNLTFVNCLKLFMLMIIILSGITMYRFVLKVVKNKTIATLAAILYVLAPYRITDMYIRVAVAELASFVFIPMIFNGLYTIINEEKPSFLLAWGTIGLILTHTVVTLYTAILCAIYLLIFIKKLKNKDVIKSLILNLLITILATSFYWVGLIQHYLATSYEVFVPGRMEVANKLEIYKTKFYQLFYTSKEQPMIYAIGLVTVIGLVLTPIAWRKIPKEYKKTYMLFLLLGIILTIMTLTFFPFEKLPGILRMIQFTFRLFEFTSFFFALIAAINYGLIIKDFKIKDVLILSLLVLLLLVPYNEKLDYNIESDENRLIHGVKVTEHTGRIHAGMASMEYLPTKAFKVLNSYIANREDVPIVIDGSSAKIENYQKFGTNMHFEARKINEDTYIELPYIYYLGYRININGKDVPYEESENGFIQVKIDTKSCENGNANVTVKYTGTNEMLICTIISVISIVILIILEYKAKNCKQGNGN
ncbi:MAG: hypothetical protein ACI4VC_03855 [Clostridia bacterium]